MTTANRADPQRMLPLWLGFLGPAVIWAIRFGASYLLVPYACWWDWVAVLHLTTVAGLAACLWTGWLAWGGWRGAGLRTDPEPTTRRTRFLGLAGILSSGFFFVVIAAEGFATFVIDPCLTANAPIQ